MPEVPCKPSEEKTLKRFLEALRKLKEVADKGIIYTTINKDDIDIVAKPEIKS